MNEEELKKGCGKELMFGGICEEDNLCIKCEKLIEGFQKGKLEQKKEDLKKWNKFKKDFCSYRSCDACNVNLEEIDKIIKQLKKEIGK